MGRHLNTNADRRLGAWIVTVGLLALVAALVQAYAIGSRVQESRMNRSLNTSLVVSSPAELESEECGCSGRRDVDVSRGEAHAKSTDAVRN